jgi:hypothetical protein
MIKLFGWTFWFIIPVLFWIGIAQADSGGMIGFRAAELYNASPIHGVCNSSCTLRLRKAVCIDRRASFILHAATTDLGTRIIANAYNERLRRFYYAYCVPSSCYLTAHDLTGFGYYLCV